jgi:hypothetical protein
VVLGNALADDTPGDALGAQEVVLRTTVIPGSGSWAEATFAKPMVVKTNVANTIREFMVFSSI